MAVAPADLLLSGGGPVDLSLFPGEGSNVILDRLGKYIANGAADPRVANQTDLVRKDNLVRAYALQQVFQGVFIRMSSEPLTLNVTEKGGHGYSYEQIRGMKGLADKYYQDFLGLLVVPADSPASQLPGTVIIRNTVEW